MKLVPCAAGAALALLLGATAAGAQEDARVLRRGYLALKVGGEFTQYDARLGSGAGSGPLGGPLAFPLPASYFPALPPVRDSLARFFAATAAAGEAFPVTDEDVFPGTLSPELAADLRRVPISVEAGVASRLTLRATLPVVRRETEVVTRRLAGATLGFNSRPDTLAALLGDIDASLAAIGRLQYLPLAGSRAGQELQRRYLRATGDTTTLPLPATALSPSQLSTLLGADRSLPFAAATEDYRVGDVEVAAKLQLLGGTSGALSPYETGARFAVEAGVRLPTAMTTGADSLTELVGDDGHAGAMGAVFADLPLGRRFWMGAQARYGMLRPRDVERFTWDPEAPLEGLGELRRYRREPGDRLEAAVTPHFQVTDDLALTGRYGFARLGETVYTAADAEAGVPAGLEATGSGTLHTAGVGLVYSTMGAFTGARTDIPLEIWLAYDAAVAGSGGVPDLGRVTLSGRIWVPTWGGR
jgi:hypothetical protein